MSLKPIISLSKPRAASAIEEMEAIMAHLRGILAELGEEIEESTAV